MSWAWTDVFLWVGAFISLTGITGVIFMGNPWKRIRELERQLAEAKEDVRILDWRDSKWDPSWPLEIRGRTIKPGWHPLSYREIVKEHMRADGIDI